MNALSRCGVKTESASPLEPSGLSPVVPICGAGRGTLDAGRGTWLLHQRLRRREREVRKQCARDAQRHYVSSKFASLHSGRVVYQPSSVLHDGAGTVALCASRRRTRRRPQALQTPPSAAAASGAAVVAPPTGPPTEPPSPCPSTARRYTRAIRRINLENGVADSDDDDGAAAATSGDDSRGAGGGPSPMQSPTRRQQEERAPTSPLMFTQDVTVGGTRSPGERRRRARRGSGGVRGAKENSAEALQGVLDFDVLREGAASDGAVVAVARGSCSHGVVDALKGMHCTIAEYESHVQELVGFDATTAATVEGLMGLAAAAAATASPAAQPLPGTPLAAAAAAGGGDSPVLLPGAGVAAPLCIEAGSAAPAAAATVGEERGVVAGLTSPSAVAIAPPCCATLQFADAARPTRGAASAAAENEGAGGGGNGGSQSSGGGGGGGGGCALGSREEVDALLGCVAGVVASARGLLLLPQQQQQQPLAEDGVSRSSSAFGLGDASVAAAAAAAQQQPQLLAAHCDRVQALEAAVRCLALPAGGGVAGAAAAAAADATAPPSSLPSSSSPSPTPSERQRPRGLLRELTCDSVGGGGCGSPAASFASEVHESSRSPSISPSAMAAAARRGSAEEAARQALSTSFARTVSLAEDVAPEAAGGTTRSGTPGSASLRFGGGGSGAPSQPPPPRGSVPPDPTQARRKSSAVAESLREFFMHGGELPEHGVSVFDQNGGGGGSSAAAVGGGERTVRSGALRHCVFVDVVLSTPLAAWRDHPEDMCTAYQKFTGFVRLTLAKVDDVVVMRDDAAASSDQGPPSATATAPPTPAAAQVGGGARRRSAAGGGGGGGGGGPPSLGTPRGCFLLVFAEAEEAVRYVVSLQLALRMLPWPDSIARVAAASALGDAAQILAEKPEARRRRMLSLAERTAVHDDGGGGGGGGFGGSLPAGLYDFVEELEEFGGGRSAEAEGMSCRAGLSVGEAWVEADSRGRPYYHGFAPMRASLLAACAQPGETVLQAAAAAVPGVAEFLAGPACRAHDTSLRYRPVTPFPPSHRHQLEVCDSVTSVLPPQGTAAAVEVGLTDRDVFAHNPNWWLPFGTVGSFVSQ